MARRSKANVENKAAFETKPAGGGVPDFDAITLMKLATN
jgi:hypothetical protein